MAGPESFAAQLGAGTEWARAFAEVERLVGGQIVHAEKQARWRPAFFLDVDCAGERKAIYLRGDRGEMQHGVYGLDHEYRVLCALEAEGIPVPHIYGFLADPLAIVMARAPGRVNLATAKDDAERTAVLDHWIDVLATLHRLPLARFEALGIERPQRPEQLGLGDFPRWEKSWRDRKSRPDPRIEWVIRWLHRNVPKHRSRPAMLQGDAGQFLFESGRVTAMIDLELAYIGDPLADLAGMLNRDLSEPMGDLNRGFHRYARLMGEPLDVKTVWYHTARFGICTPIACAPLLATPPPQFNYPVYLGWDIVYGRIALEAIARFSGITLREPELPEPTPSRHAPGFDQLLTTLAAAGRSYEVDTAYRIAQWARELDARGPGMEQDDADEVARLTGSRASPGLEADRALEAFVLGAGAERDEQILQLLYRRTKRQQALMQPALRELEHAKLSELRDLTGG
jgi:aminoglycoside phosphotransferase (APT) family kinase protein